MLKVIRRWCPLVLVALIAAGVLQWLRGRHEHRAAQRADERADSAANVADSLQRVAARLAHRSDSLESALDTVTAREHATRDSLRHMLRLADQGAQTAREEVATWSGALDTTHAELLRRVRPELRSVVRRAMAEKDSMASNRDRLLAGLRRKVDLLADDTSSFARENAQLRETLSGVTTERDSLRSLVQAKDGVILHLTDARDRWRDAATRPWWESLLGGDVLEGAVNVAGAVAAFRYDTKAGLGYVGARALDAAVGAIRP